MYEVMLVQKRLDATKWQKFLHKIADCHNLGTAWSLYVQIDEQKIRFFLETKNNLPASINAAPEFLLKKCDKKNLVNVSQSQNKSSFSWPFYVRAGEDLVDLINFFHTRRKQEVLALEAKFCKMAGRRFFTETKLYTNVREYLLLGVTPAAILAVDFENNHHLKLRQVPKYLDCSKLIAKRRNSESNKLAEPNKSRFLEIKTFPYGTGLLKLGAGDFDFEKHSIIFGASGTGKSKLISLLIKNVFETTSLRDKTKIVVIDPHAALEKEIGGLGQVINFIDQTRSINLFESEVKEKIVAVELLLEVFNGLLLNNSSKLERVLRHSLFLLLEAEDFNFQTLRKLLLETEFRDGLVTRHKKQLPSSVMEFFLTEFNEIRTNAYAEAISPIIALIDEMEMLPIFNAEFASEKLSDVVAENFLTIFSLDRTKLGDKITKTVAALVMEQLLTLIQTRESDEQIILIVDEVAAVENPILKRFLAEARKYKLTVILAGQYFGAVSPELREAIFANVVNYFLFRLAKDDAILLADKIAMKIPLDDTPEQKIKVLAGLQNRECVARISVKEEILPAVLARTVEFESSDLVKTSKEIVQLEKVKEGEIMGEFVPEKIANQIMSRVFGREIKMSLEEVLRKFASDVTLPKQVVDADGVKTWTNVIGAEDFITQDHAYNREWERQKKELHTIEDVLKAWREIDLVTTERQMDSINILESDTIYGCQNTYRCNNSYHCQNIIYCDDCNRSEFLLASSRSATSNFAIRVNDSQKCSGSFAVSYSNKIIDSMFIQDAFDLYECMFCAHISSKKFCIANMQFEESEYYKIKKQVIDWILQL